MAQSSNEESPRLNLRIKFRSENLESFVERYGSDVSSGGIFIRSKTPLELGTKVSFALSLINGVPVLVGDGTVVWARTPEAATAVGNPGMGIRFDQLTDESRVNLTQVLQAKAAHDLSGKPSVRGPTPIPEPPGSGFGVSEPTARMRLTTDGRIVRDMPQAPEPPPIPMGVVPSQPYAASFSQPHGVPLQRNPGQDSEATRVAAPPRERLRNATPAKGPVSPQPFALSKTLNHQKVPPAGSGGVVLRASNPGPSRSAPRSLPPALPGQDAMARAHGFDSGASTRAAGGAAFSTTAAFGSEATRGQGFAAGVAPTPAGATPTPDLLRQATGPTAPVTRPSQIFSRPTPLPPVPVNENRAGARSGPVVNRPSANMPVVRQEAPRSPSGWGDDKTEIVDQLPSFEEPEEKNTTVKGHALAQIEGHHRPSTQHEVPTFQASRRTGHPADQLDQFSVTPGPTSMPELGNLFDGEGLPSAAESSSLLDSLGAEPEFARAESTGRGRRLSPGGAGSSMVAHKASYVEDEHPRGRPWLWVLLAIVAVGAGIYGYVEYTTSRQAVRVLAPTVVAEPPVAPEGMGNQPAPAADPVGGGPAAETTAGAAAAPAAPTPAAAAPVAAPPTNAEPSVENKDPVAAPSDIAKRTPRGAAASRPRPAALAAPATEAQEDAKDADAVYWLRVKSVPSGAEVYIDGEAEGNTPFQRRVFDSTRPYALSVRKLGYEAHERVLSASDPWVRTRGEYILTITVKLRKLPNEAAAPERDPDEAGKATDQNAGDPVTP